MFQRRDSFAQGICGLDQRRRVDQAPAQQAQGGREGAAARAHQRPLVDHEVGRVPRGLAVERALEHQRTTGPQQA